jgi:hypothetical protein
MTACESGEAWIFLVEANWVILLLNLAYEPELLEVPFTVLAHLDLCGM